MSGVGVQVSQATREQLGQNLTQARGASESSNLRATRSKLELE